MDEHDKILIQSEITDPILSERQWTLYPIKYPQIFDLAKKSVASFWTVEEIDFAADVVQINDLSLAEHASLLVALGFFAQADGLVMENVSGNFMPRIALPEAQYFYSIQMAMEAIHSEAYSLMLDTYLSNSMTREATLKHVQTLPSVKAKNDWAIQWMKSDRPFAVQVVAFCCVEAIFFSSSFALIFYFRKRGLLPGLSQANDYISRDEGMHVQFGCTLLRMLSKSPTQECFEKVVKSAVDVEKVFVEELLAESLPGFHRTDLIQHIESQADMLADLCGYTTIYNQSTPFDFMRMQTVPGKANFFEKRPSEYRKAVEKVTHENQNFYLVDEF